MTHGCLKGKKVRQMRNVLLGVVLLAAIQGAFADSVTVKIQSGEKWWGLCNSFGREMPFTEKSEFSCDLRLDNYSHQSLSFLCSDKGRVVWCDEPIGVKISGGEIRLESDKGEIIVKRGVL
jgi:hypothetical protein